MNNVSNSIIDSFSRCQFLQNKKEKEILLMLICANKAERKFYGAYTLECAITRNMFANCKTRENLPCLESLNLP